MKNLLKNVFIVLMMFVLINCNFKVQADSTKDIPEFKIKVGFSGIVSDDTLLGLDFMGGVLTDNSDTLLHGSKMYTYDSEKHNKLNGVNPGETLYGNTGYIIKDVKGEKVTELKVEVQPFINVTKHEVGDMVLKQVEGVEDEVVRNVYEDIAQLTINSKNVVSSTYGTYLDDTRELTIKFFDDGSFSIDIPEDFPNDYLYAITAIEDPDSKRMQPILTIDRLFIAIGDGSNSEGGPQTDEDDEDPDIDKDDEHLYYSMDTSFMNYADMEPSLSASISSEIYDVQKGIPTSENVNYSISADNALYNIVTRKKTINAGVKDITIKLVAYYPQKYTEIVENESGDEVEVTKTKTLSVSKTVTKEYSYDMPTVTLYDVPISNIYPVMNGSISAVNKTDILSSGAISLAGSNTKGAQTLNVKVSKPNVKEIEYGYLGTFESKSKAQAALNANDGTFVKNRIKGAVHAAVNYTGNVNYSYYGLNVTTNSSNGVKPVVATSSGGSTQLIPSTYANGTYNASGSVTYAGGKSFSLSPNNVIVHTPVVNSSNISSTSKFVNQKINKDSNVKYLMLDEQFTISVPDNGTHNSIKGYGTRTYNSKQGVNKLSTTWGKIKDVKLPFDAYLHYTKNGATYKYFIKANTWLSDSGASSVISLTSNNYTYTIPVWAKEGTCNIETRVIAENAIEPSMYSLSEDAKNSSVENYVATKTIPVEIIGKIYDLRVSASNDPGWESIYSWKNKTNYIAADEFPFGAQGQNKITQYKYAPKVGYTFVFDFKTKGTKSNNIDVSIQPEGFYFVGKDGKNLQEVDLYYNTTTKKNIKITTTDNNVSLNVKLKDAFMRVPAQEFVDSTRIYNSKYNYSLGVKVGTFAKMNLPHSLRLCYNNFAEYINALYGKGTTESSISNNAGARDTVIGSVGHWYAGYRLPASTMVVAKGGDITTAIKNNSLLKDGYIIVKFDIKTKYQTGSNNYDYLQYMGPEAINEAGDNTGTLIVDWTKGGTQDITLPNGNKASVPIGSVALFEASLRSSNDLEIGGTH